MLENQVYLIIEKKQMALLVKERKALEQLEQAFVRYYEQILHLELVVDHSTTVEERLLFLAAELNTAQ